MNENWNEEESNLVAHAKRELELAGMYDADADYDGLLAPHILDLIRLFASEGHSGGSAAVTLGVFERLARYKTLSPLTDDPEEWMQVEMGDKECWQSRRQSSCFSSDSGKTYYDIDEKDRPMHTSKVGK